ncbi:histidyl-tRNA synthetase [Hypnocyclicus thermotrophus]|uniref:Histidine--tRNA ligase n=1 Tax=Hypnocyclicus thermotrophus TaxID=1627895 RepID=A0AA46DXP7_9FUSO|nr:histidine--tRNA ligase [Hypnocyclicus thermotrophus]TDT68580.1 histidyl-tRNA synthetase [Hypnocyclicus thermotrophus]
MNIRAVRGTKDIFNDDAIKYNYITEIAKRIFENFNYNRIITPIFEETALFKRGIGEGTDIVEKEMYTFLDKGERSITLRPEGTASVVRAYLEHKIYGNEEITKWYYYGPMFRYERPQAGRYREFNQLGVEVLGSKNPKIDAEVIYMGYKLLEKIGISDLRVEINSVGGKETRLKYRKDLLKYLKDKKENLCNDCQTRYEKNPLRVLDCKVEKCKEIVKKAPILTEYLSEKEKKHYEEVKRLLNIYNIPFSENPKLVRGLDYYSNIVFEVITEKLGAQGTVLAGGRYDGLISTMGGKDTPAVGFAAGIERIMLLMNEKKTKKNRIGIVWLGEESSDYALLLANELRVNNFDVYMEYEKKSLRAQMKKIDKINAKYAIIVGEEEVKENKLVVKNLKTGEQIKIKRDTICEYMKGEINEI